MANVPIYGLRQINKAPDQTPYRNFSATAESFGADQARQIGYAGSVLKNMSEDIHKQIMYDKNIQDAALARDASSQAREAIRGVLSNIQETNGPDSINIYNTAKEEIAKIRKEHSSIVKDSKEASALYERSMYYVSESALNEAFRIQRAKIREYNTNTYKASNYEAIQESITDPLNDIKYKQAKQHITVNTIGMIRNISPDIKGKIQSKDISVIEKAEVDMAINNLALQRFKAMAEISPKGALAFYEANKKNLVGVTKTELARLENDIKQREVLEWVVNEAQGMSYEDQLKAADKKYKDPEMNRMARYEIDVRHSRQKTIEAEKQAALEDQVISSLLQSNDPSQINIPEGLDAKSKLGIQKYIASYWKNKRVIPDNDELFYKLKDMAISNPKQFKELNLLKDYLSKLSKDQFSDIWSLQEKARKDKKEYKSFLTEHQRVVNTLGAAGITSKENPDKFAEIMKAIDDEFNLRKPETYDEKMNIINQAIIDYGFKTEPSVRPSNVPDSAVWDPIRNAYIVRSEQGVVSAWSMSGSKLKVPPIEYKDTKLNRAIKSIDDIDEHLKAKKPLMPPGFGIWGFGI